LSAESTLIDLYRELAPQRIFLIPAGIIHTAARAKSESLLIGRIYDDRGNRMSPSHAREGTRI
jgi:hypothetical protein